MSDSIAAVTVKQVEAFHWTCLLESMVRASEKLNIAQSTLSKRIAELEAALGMALFERSGRAVALTSAGRRLVPVAADFLREASRFREVAGNSAHYAGVFRFGVTELVALTWLSDLVIRIRADYPGLVPQPEVDASEVLFDRLERHEIDLVIGVAPAPGRFDSVPLEDLDVQWMCAPDFGPDGDQVAVEAVAGYPILTQTEDSGIHRLVTDWFRTSAVVPNRIVHCNSIHVLASLAMAGLGLTVLNDRLFRHDLAAGRLRVVRTATVLPAVRYAASFQRASPTSLPMRVAGLAQACCAFDRSLR